MSPGAAAAIARAPAEFIGKQLTRLFRFRESADGALPILTALAEHKSFDGQAAELRGGRKGRYLLSGVPLIDGAGRFAGFRGAAAACAARRPLAGGRAAAAARRLRLRRAARRGACAARSPTSSTMPSGCAPSREGPLRRDYAGYAEDIASAGRHLLALVDDLVDLQAVERPDFRPRPRRSTSPTSPAAPPACSRVRAAARDVTHRRPGRRRGAARDRRFHPRAADR